MLLATSIRTCALPTRRLVGASTPASLSSRTLPSPYSQQSAVQLPCYPYKIVDGVERDHLDEMSSYLAAALLPRRIKPYDRGLLVEVPQCESKKELEAAFKRGTIHFSSNLSIARDGKAKPERLSVRLAPPAAGMGSALYRRFGSDRFFVSSPTFASVVPH